MVICWSWINQTAWLETGRWEVKVWNYISWHRRVCAVHCSGLKNWRNRSIKLIERNVRAWISVWWWNATILNNIYSMNKLPWWRAYLNDCSDGEEKDEKIFVRIEISGYRCGNQWKDGMWYLTAFISFRSHRVTQVPVAGLHMVANTSLHNER